MLLKFLTEVNFSAYGTLRSFNVSDYEGNMLKLNS